MVVQAVDLLDREAGVDRGKALVEIRFYAVVEQAVDLLDREVGIG